jgi:hypothetical protein
MCRTTRNDSTHCTRREVRTREQFDLPLRLHRIQFARHVDCCVWRALFLLALTGFISFGVLLLRGSIRNLACNVSSAERWETCGCLSGM